MVVHIISGMDADTAKKINVLKKLCEEQEHISLKLEIPYKLAAYGSISDDKAYAYEDVIDQWQSDRLKLSFDYTDVLCLEGEYLIAYIGICNFGNMPIEVSGMVHPDYRRRGIFRNLFNLIEVEWHQLENQGMLLLSDRQSKSGINFIEHLKASYSHTEYEMILNENKKPDLIKGSVTLRLATNNDADEIAFQNSLYNFCDYDEAILMKPEDEIARGMNIYLALHDHKIIGKVHTQIDDESGGIFGFGVVPSYRHMGFGKIILHKAIDLLLEANVPKIYLQVEANNQEALNLYTSSGFEIVSAMNYYLFNRPRIEIN